MNSSCLPEEEYSWRGRPWVKPSGHTVGMCSSTEPHPQCPEDVCVRTEGGVKELALTHHTGPSWSVLLPHTPHPKCNSNLTYKDPSRARCQETSLNLYLCQIFPEDMWRRLWDLHAHLLAFLMLGKLKLLQEENLRSKNVTRHSCYRSVEAIQTRDCRDGHMTQGEPGWTTTSPEQVSPPKGPCLQRGWLSLMTSVYLFCILTRKS